MYDPQRSDELRIERPDTIGLKTNGMATNRSFRFPVGGVARRINTRKSAQVKCYTKHPMVSIVGAIREGIETHSAMVVFPFGKQSHTPGHEESHTNLSIETDDVDCASSKRLTGEPDSREKRSPAYSNIGFPTLTLIPGTESSPML